MDRAKIWMIMFSLQVSLLVFVLPLIQVHDGACNDSKSARCAALKDQIEKRKLSRALKYERHAVRQLKVGRRDVAITDLEKARNLAPNDKTISSTLVSALLDRATLRAQGRDKRALSDFDQVLALDAENEKALFGRARIHIKQKDCSSALPDLDRLAQAEAAELEARLLKGRCYLEFRRYRDAEVEFRAVLALDADNSEAFGLLREVEHAIGGEGQSKHP